MLTNWGTPGAKKLKKLAHFPSIIPRGRINRRAGYSEGGTRKWCRFFCKVCCQEQAAAATSALVADSCVDVIEQVRKWWWWWRDLIWIKWKKWGRRDNFNFRKRGVRDCYELHDHDRREAGGYEGEMPFFLINCMLLGIH